MKDNITLYIILIALILLFICFGKYEENTYGIKLYFDIGISSLIIAIISFVLFVPWGNHITEQREYIDVIPEQNKYYIYENKGNILTYFNSNKNRLAECNVDIENIKIYQDSHDPYIEIKTSRCLLNIEYYNEVIECNIHLPKNK